MITPGTSVKFVPFDLTAGRVLECDGDMANDRQSVSCPHTTFGSKTTRTQTCCTSRNLPIDHVSTNEARDERTLRMRCISHVPSSPFFYNNEQNGNVCIVGSSVFTAAYSFHCTTIQYLNGRTWRTIHLFETHNVLD